MLAERDRLLVMAPQRQGRWGLEAIHRALLGSRLEGELEDLPAGTPVLCRRNLPELDLANGDVGVLVGGPGPAARLLFGDGDGDGFWIHPGQLAGAAEPALALTVHKAQGSEAEHVIVLFPRDGRRDGRLLYTALTRARAGALLLTAMVPSEEQGRGRWGVSVLHASPRAAMCQRKMNLPPRATPRVPYFLHRRGTPGPNSPKPLLQ